MHKNLISIYWIMAFVKIIVLTIVIVLVYLSGCKLRFSNYILTDDHYNSNLYNDDVSITLHKYTQRYQFAQTHFTDDKNIMNWLEQCMRPMWNSTDIGVFTGGYENTKIYLYKANINVRKYCNDKATKEIYHLRYKLDSIHAPNLVRNFIILSNRLKFFNKKFITDGSFSLANKSEFTKYCSGDISESLENQAIRSAKLLFNREDKFTLFANTPFYGNLFSPFVYKLQTEYYACINDKGELSIKKPKKGDLVYRVFSAHRNEILTAQVDGTAFGIFISDFLDNSDSMNDIQLNGFAEYIGEQQEIDNFYQELKKTYLNEKCFLTVENIQIEKVGEQAVFANDKLIIPKVGQYNIFNCNN